MDVQTWAMSPATFGSLSLPFDGGPFAPPRRWSLRTLLASPVGALDGASVFGRRTTRTDSPAVTRQHDDFDQFFVENYGPLVRSLTFITGDATLAEDAVQDAFQRAFVRWNRIRRYDAPVTWVRRVAINRSRDLLRSEKRRRRNEERAAVDEVVHDEAADDDLARLFADLPERQRTAMALYYLDGLSVEQVAATMGISTGAVKYHMNQGREKLRPLLERDRS
ncbi:MAG: SigE family RNA polymerase sigma factor [Actinomyces sp.]|nr:MAG: SigE family RNA polymerase sigma factor [Actinomyces sp.]